MPNAIFTIDKDDMHSRMKFLRYLDQLRAMGKTQAPPRLAVIHSVLPDGVSLIRQAYVMDTFDLEKHVIPHGWVNKTTYAMVFNAVACWLRPMHDVEQPIIQLGELTCVGKVIPPGDWVRMDDTGDFWKVALHGRV